MSYQKTVIAIVTLIVCLMATAVFGQGGWNNYFYTPPVMASVGDTFRVPLVTGRNSKGTFQDFLFVLNMPDTLLQVVDAQCSLPQLFMYNWVRPNQLYLCWASGESQHVRNSDTLVVITLLAKKAGTIPGGPFLRAEIEEHRVSEAWQWPIEVLPHAWEQTIEAEAMDFKSWHANVVIDSSCSGGAYLHVRNATTVLDTICVPKDTTYSFCIQAHGEAGGGYDDLEFPIVELWADGVFVDSATTDGSYAI